MDMIFSKLIKLVIEAAAIIARVGGAQIGGLRMRYEEFMGA